MQIEQLQVALKPRTMWECADLGTKLALRWFPSLAIAWLLIALPFLFIAMQFERFLIQLLFLWWFKPLYERTVLMALSILIFDGRLTIRGILRGFTDTRLWFYLTLFRFSWRRSENTPIDALEELDFTTQSQRRQWLYASDNRIAVIVTSFGLMIEAIIVLALIALFYFFTQSDFNSAYAGALKILNINEIGKQESTFLLSAIFIAMGVSAVFYVSVGFATYLNRRTIKEGWDLELGFKKIVNRLGVLVLSAALVLPGLEAIARESASDVEAVLSEVLNAPEFNQTKTIIVPEHLSEYVHDLFRVEDVEPSRIQVGIGSRVVSWILKFILISSLIVAFVFLIYKFHATYGSGVLRRRAKGSDFTQSIRVRSLPANVLQTIQQHWLNQEIRESLSLLYSASVIYVDAKFTCNIKECDTEGECIRKTRDIQEDARDTLLEITQLWMQMAYAKTTPSEERFRSALQRFEKHVAPA